MTTDVEPEVNITGWKQSPPDYHDYTLANRMPEVLRLAAPPSLASLTLGKFPVLDQISIGACTVFAAGADFRYIDVQDGKDFDIAELAQYYWARLESGLPVDQDTGAYNRSAVKTFDKYGTAPEGFWPYYVQNFRNRPTPAVEAEAAKKKAIEYISVPNDVETMKQVLSAGFPIIIGFSVYSNYQSAISTGIWPEAAGSQVGGHAVLVDGYEPGWWIFRNSWGLTGLPTQRGWYKMSNGYLQQNGADFWTMRKVTADVVTPPEPPSPPPPPPPVETEEQQLQRLLDKYYGHVSQIDVHFSKNRRWFLPIKPPGNVE